MNLEIVNSNALKWAKALGIYSHPKELKAALRDAQAELRRTLMKVDPTYNWKTAPYVLDAGFDGWRTTTTIEFRCPPITYEGLATDLVHPDTVITPEAADLHLEVFRTVNHCRIRVSLMVSAELNAEEIQTLRQCGAMRDVVETTNRTETRTIVQCELPGATDDLPF